MSEELTEGQEALAASVAEASLSADGRSLEVLDKTRAIAALEMHAAGSSWKKIRKATGIGWPAFMRLKSDHQEALGIRQKEAAREAAIVHAKSAALLERRLDMLGEDDEALANESVRDLSVTFGVTADKMQVLNGSPSAIVEERSGLTLKEAAEFLADLKRRKEAREVAIDAEEVQNGAAAPPEGQP